LPLKEQHKLPDGSKFRGWIFCNQYWPIHAHLCKLLKSPFDLQQFVIVFILNFGLEHQLFLKLVGHTYADTHTHTHIHTYIFMTHSHLFWISETFAWNFCISLYIWIFYQNNRMCVKSFTTQFSFCCPLHIYHFWLRLVLGVYSTWHQTALHYLNGYVCMYVCMHACMHVYNNWR